MLRFIPFIFIALSFSMGENKTFSVDMGRTLLQQVQTSISMNQDVEDFSMQQDIKLSDNAEQSDLKITVGESVFYATFEANSSAKEFQELLLQGPITIQMNDYGGFEKVGSLGTEITRNDSQITTEPGDIILYQGDQITIYYDTNSWNFTRLAKINDPSDLKEKLGKGTIQVTFSLE